MPCATLPQGHTPWQDVCSEGRSSLSLGDVLVAGTILCGGALHVVSSWNGAGKVGTETYVFVGAQCSMSS